MPPTPAPPSGPPQSLPISAQWCLVRQQQAPLQPDPPCILLEQATTHQQQQWGLMGRPPLAPLRGMWFPFEPAIAVKFWMHRTPAPLDMVFVREGRVIAIEANASPCLRLPCPSYGPDDRSDGVVELGAGQAAALGIVVGSPALIQAKTKGSALVKAGGGLKP